jgi:hypothetical protein
VGTASAPLRSARELGRPTLKQRLCDEQHKCARSLRWTSAGLPAIWRGGAGGGEDSGGGRGTGGGYRVILVGAGPAREWSDGGGERRGLIVRQPRGNAKTTPGCTGQERAADADWLG